jgi:hypothetical protein
MTTLLVTTGTMTHDLDLVGEIEMIEEISQQDIERRQIGEPGKNPGKGGVI